MQGARRATEIKFNEIKFNETNTNKIKAACYGYAETESEQIQTIAPSNQ